MNFNLADSKQVKHIVNKASKVFNIPLNALLSKSRKKDLNIARMCIANIAMEEHQIHKDLIADGLVRDRCSIYYYEKQHKSQYSNWAEYRNKFNLLHSSLFYGSKPKLNKTEIMRILKENKMKSSRGQVSILITSGAGTYDFKTNYADMCEATDKIREIFSDHEVHIDIMI
jgi:hypothetical protein|tara:strand:- start:1172 stop:1684 length:513 start_codon:yes stop_codon:yes gene_type:complete